jgi:hypothetical protein
MSFAEGDMRDWFRWRYGSQRWYTPDYYKIGYMTVAGMRYNYDATMFMSDYLWNLGSPFAFNAVQKSMKKYSGKRIKGTWNDIAATFKDIWAQDDSLRAPFQEIVNLTPKTRFFTNFRGAVQTKDGRVFALRAAMDKPQELVELLPDGTVKTIRPMSADSKLVYSTYTNRIYWSESVPDVRWDMVQTSRIRYIALGDKHVSDLTKGGRFVTPAVSNDGTMLAAAEYPLTGGSRIVLMDPLDGEVIKSITAPDGLQVTELAFIDNGLVVFTGISDDGMGLYFTDFATVGTYEKAVPVKIKNLISRDGILYFTCDRTGTNEIYSYSSGTLTQLTNTQHGVSSPFFKDDVLCFSALSPAGSLLATTAEPLYRPASFQDYAPYPIADVLSAQEKEFTAVDTQDKYYSQRPNYSKLKNFFHIHSWAPVYYNWDSFYSSQTNYMYETASLGAMAFFQNLTGTASGSIGASVHSNPFDEDKIAAGFHARIKYTGLYPVLSLSLDVGDRNNVFITNGIVTKTDSTVVKMYSGDNLFIGGEFGVTVPLNLSSGGYETVIEPGISFKFSNDALAPALSFFKTTKDGIKKEPTYNKEGNEIETLYYTNKSIIARITAETKSQVAPSQVIPRSGFGGELRMVYAPLPNYVGSGFYMDAHMYLPGISSTHGLKLTGAYQKRRQTTGSYFTEPKKDWQIRSKPYSLPTDTWAIGFEDLAPRGFEKTGAGTSLLVFSPFSARISADYVAPCLSIDRSLSPYIYLRNLEINPFADFSMFNPRTFSYLYSAGADIILHFEKFFMLSNTLKLGVRVAYNGGSELYDSLGLDNPYYVGFVVNPVL